MADSRIFFWQVKKIFPSDVAIKKFGDDLETLK
jgi:hypothetical protein